MDKPGLRIVIMDDSEDVTSTIADYFSGFGRYNVIGTARDGEQGLALIREYSADVAIIDLLMPGKDGFYVLDEIKRFPGDKPVCIVLSGVGQDSVTRMAFEKGADYYMLKPFDLTVLGRRVDEVFERRCAQNAAAPRKTIAVNPEDYVMRLLHNIPIPNTLNGYEYLKQAIVMAIEDGTLIDGVTKRLYPLLGRKNKSTGQRIERAIRHAIERAWEKGGGSNFTRLMGYQGGAAPRPTNSAFITAVVERYHVVYGHSSNDGSDGVTKAVL